MKLNTILLYFNTVKSLSFRQTIGRMYAKIKIKFHLYRLPPVPKLVETGINNCAEFIEVDEFNSRDEILKGNFCFSNEKNTLGNPIDWNPKLMKPACNLHIHFFNFLYLLHDNEKIEICRSWINYHTIGQGNAQYPYAASLRICSWIRCKVNDQIVNESLYTQAAFLYRNNEFYVPANHYLENAKALIFAGLYFNGAGESNKWLQKGLRILKKEIPIQVLEDGGYYERTFTYQRIAFQILLDVINILPDKYPEKKKFINTAKKMADFYLSILHPDKNIALFSDSILDKINQPEIILNYAEKVIKYSPVEKNNFYSTGYFRYKTDDIFFIIDGGIISPDRIPGHGHADIFSYELSVNDDRIIIDSGVSTYTEGKSRDYCRSTRAHNTVCVDGKNQAELWGSFRVGRRFEPHDVKTEIQNEYYKFSGFFDGFSKMIGDNIVHYRIVEIFSKEKKIIIKDEVKGIGNHLVESMIHLHPEVNILVEDERIELSNRNIFIKILSGAIRIENGTYSPQLGYEIPNKVISLYSKSHLPITLVYEIHY
jgi:hypothetical protein